MGNEVSGTVVMFAGGVITLVMIVAALLAYAGTGAAGTQAGAIDGTATGLQAALPYLAVLFTFGAAYAVIRGRR